MNPAVQSWGTALPAHAIDQSDAAALAAELTAGGNGHARVLPALYRRSGVHRRHSVLLDANNGSKPNQDFYRLNPQSSSPGLDLGPSTSERMALYQRLGPELAARAAKSAIEAAGSDEKITHLVSVSCSGFFAPGIDITLLKDLGLAPTVERTHIGFMGCHGALNGLRVARAICAADPRARALLCALELCSLHYQFGTDSDTIVSNALFADGAAAAVIAAGGENKWKIAATGSCVLPESLDAMSWRIGNHGFEMTLSARVPELIARDLRPWIEEWLAANGMRLEDVATWAAHPGGPRILDAVEQALGLGSDALATSRDVLAECGNMSSPTILFILERLAKANAARPCVALGFGPGLVAEAVLFL
ncbi:type III polyketide synthase [bacterium]|nr:type III polyketide synthase [bacterium]